MAWGQKSRWRQVEEKKKELGVIPSETCPEIDKIIQKIEELRMANSVLRNIGKEWYDFADNLAAEYDELADEKEKVDGELETAQAKIRELEAQLN